MRRRDVLKVLGGLALAPLLPTRVAAQDVDEPRHSIIGFSQAGRPLVVYHLGGGPRRLFLMGGQHGGPESNTVDLAGSLLAHFAEQPGALPAGVGLDVMVVGNPDGLAAGSRQYLSGVDPNRNWPGADWQSDAWDSNGQLRAGLGGPEPFSEQESRAVRDWLLANRPDLTINYHSAGGFMFGPWDGPAGALAGSYASASGYYRPTPSSGSGGGQRMLTYRATGSMNVWMRGQGLNGLFIELTTPHAPELQRNLAGVRSVLELLASSPRSGVAQPGDEPSALAPQQVSLP